MQMSRREYGSVLIAGLLLLAVLSLLAIAGVQTSTLELALTGNEQYRAQAFQAAQAGIERIVAGGTFASSAAEYSQAETLEGEDRYTAIVRPRGTTAPPPESEAFRADHFEIESTGHAPRGARFTVVQGLSVLQPGNRVVRTYWYSKDGTAAASP